MRTAIQAKLPNESLRAKTRLIYAGLGRRGVLENRGDEKNRPDEARTEFRNVKSVDRNRRPDQQCAGGRVVIIAGGDKSDGASVFDLVRIAMDAFVQLRGRAEGKGPEKSRGSENRDRSTDDRAAFH